jgi:hypothetical protein
MLCAEAGMVNVRLTPTVKHNAAKWAERVMAKRAKTERINEQDVGMNTLSTLTRTVVDRAPQI